MTSIGLFIASNIGGGHYLFIVGHYLFIVSLLFVARSQFWFIGGQCLLVGMASIC